MAGTFSFSDLTIGNPVGHRELTAFPLIGVPRAKIEYVIFDDALEAGDVIVEEVSESGSVPELRLINFSDDVILIVDGTELKGAKQNRVVNASLLIPPKSSTRIPVSCVEEGRWRYTTKKFEKSEYSAAYSIRMKIAMSQKESLRDRRGYAADQSAVWDEVRKISHRAKAHSPTFALRDVYEKKQTTLSSYLKKVKLSGKENGMAFFVGSRFIGLDIFDRPDTFSRSFEKILTAAAIEAIGSETEKPESAEGLSSSLKAVLEDITDAPFEKYQLIGLGEDYRFEGKVSFGKGLYFEGDLIHFSAFGKVEGALI